MAYYGLLDIQMSIHHIICIVGMSMSLANDLSANHIVLAMFVAEASNPFMHLRVVLKQYGLRYTKAYESLEFAFMAIYIYGRLLIGPFLVYRVLSCDQSHFLFKFFSIALQA